MPQLSIIVPTYDEVLNVANVRNLVAAALSDIEWEIVYVDDDSPDKTADLVRRLAQDDHRVRCIQRIGRRGLASACVEGMLASSSPVVAVMDADLQHDERLLEEMFRVLAEDAEVDIVVGSRYVDGGSTEGWHPLRARLSQWATKLGNWVLRAEVRDPMSGFFMIRREAAEASIRSGMSNVGFKILFDLFASAPSPLRFRELPYRFRNRAAGESKLGASVAWDYFVMVLNHATKGIIPVRFIGFALVGAVGLLVHMSVFVGLYAGLGIGFLAAQATATLVAMTGNFLLNNELTYRDMRLRGIGLVTGWMSFVAACSIGGLANLGVAGWLFASEPNWWLASSAAGVLAGTVWNYAVTNLFTWSVRRAA